MADFNPDEFKTNNGNNINPLLNQPTKSTVNPLAGHLVVENITVRIV
jgi:hypothetical protein